MTMEKSIQILLLLIISWLSFSHGQPKISNPCKINEFRCLDGSKCLPTEKLCNDRRDCPQGEDELGNEQWNCKREGLGEWCDSVKMFSCRFGGCINKEKICDGFSDCWGGTDESIDTCTPRQRPMRIRVKPKPSRTTKATSRPRPTSVRTTKATSRPRPTSRPSSGYIRTTTRRTTTKTTTPRTIKTTTKAAWKVSSSSPAISLASYSGISSAKRSCPPIEEHHTLGFEVTCRNSIGKRISCDVALPVGAQATYRCRKYYMSPRVGPSTTTRACTSDGVWTPLRRYYCILDCGIGGSSEVALITGGVSSTRGKWPWHVAIFQKDSLHSDDDWSLICGGSLISPTAVLTAGHCVTQKNSDESVKPHELIVALGKHDRDYYQEEDGEQIRDVVSIHPHEYYNHYNLDNDIAIIFLDEPVEITDYVRPVCLPKEGHDYYDAAPGRFGYLTGWGRTTGGSFVNELQEAKLPVVEGGICRDSHPTFATIVRPTTFCAGYRNGTSACTGDSGGGLVFLELENRRRFKVQGIVSAGVSKSSGGGGCEENYYTVFTKVIRYEKWIDGVLDTFSRYKRR